MKIYQFNERVPDEHSCKMDIKERREKEGMRCKKCGGSNGISMAASLEQ
jgi:hypothetical protein